MTRLGAAALALALATSPAAAQQDYSWAAGFHAGGVYFTAMNEGGGAALLEMEPGWIVGAQAERWFGVTRGHVGLRVNGGVTQRPLEMSGTTRDIGVWMVDAEFLLRMLPASPNGRFNIFLSAGGGLVNYRLGEGEALEFGDANAFYAGSETPRWAVAGGLGFDVITGSWWDSQPVGLRVEAVNHMVFDSPFAPIDGDSFAPIHNVRLVLGLFSGFGVLR